MQPFEVSTGKLNALKKKAGTYPPPPSKNKQFTAASFYGAVAVALKS